MVPLLSPTGKGDTQDRAECRGCSIVPMLFFSQSTVFSKRGYG